MADPSKPRAKRGQIVMQLTPGDVRKIVQEHVALNFPDCDIVVEHGGAGMLATITKRRLRKAKKADARTLPARNELERESARRNGE
jgi:hypothetical protein